MEDNEEFKVFMANQGVLRYLAAVGDTMQGLGQSYSTSTEAKPKICSVTGKTIDLVADSSGDQAHDQNVSFEMRCPNPNYGQRMLLLAGGDPQSSN